MFLEASHGKCNDVLYEERLKTQGRIPEYYKRYVDGTLGRAASIGEAESFHQILNDAHLSFPAP